MVRGWGWGRQNPQRRFWRGWASSVVLSAPLVARPVFGRCLSGRERFALQEELKPADRAREGWKEKRCRASGGLFALAVVYSQEAALLPMLLLSRPAFGGAKRPCSPRRHRASRRSLAACTPLSARGPPRSWGRHGGGV